MHEMHVIATESFYLQIEQEKWFMKEQYFYLLE